MAPIDLNWMRAFREVYETGSFSLAAERLGVPRSTVSRAVASLESGLGTILFHRTTRKVATTQEGRALYDRSAGALKGLESALQETPRREEVPTGTLRVTTTIDLGTTLLAEAAVRFTARYPEACVETHLSNEVVDLVRNGFDAALRVFLNKPRDSSLITRKLGSGKFYLYAAPTYLARRGTPRTADDLAEHDRVAYPAVRALRFGTGRSKSSAARLLCDDMLYAREVLRNGGGIGGLPAFLAAADVANGLLVRVLPGWEASAGELCFVHPGRRNVPMRVTAFRDLLIDLLRVRPLV